MIILDTNVLSELMKSTGSTTVRNWAAGQPVTSLFTTTITQAEILYGIAILPDILHLLNNRVCGIALPTKE